MKGKKLERFWMRAGDNADYEDFDSPYDAGYRLSIYFEGAKKMPKLAKANNYGVSIEPSFTGYNYVSIFWGDKDAQPTRKETSAQDIAELRRGIADGADIPSAGKAKPHYRITAKGKATKKPARQLSLKGMR